MRIPRRSFAHSIVNIRLWTCSILCATTGCGDGVEDLDAKRPNVILVTMDTTRADHLGCYGYPYSTSPSIDAIARDGVLFRQAYTSAPLTAPAHASLMTGNFPFWHEIRDNFLMSLKPEIPTWAEHMKTLGYRTSAVVSAAVLGAQFGLDQGFDAYVDLSARALDLSPQSANMVTDEALKVLEKQDSEAPFMLWVHYFDPHLPYQPPESFASEFENPYDAEIASMDREIGRLIDELDQRFSDRDLLKVLIADHGEDLFEHGEEDHGKFLYESTVRIPLIMAGGGLPRDLSVDSLVRIVDVFPTVVDWIGAPTESPMQGYSLAHALKGDEAWPQLDAYMETYHTHLSFGWSWLEALREGDGEFKWIDAPRGELYNLAIDPNEGQNLLNDDEDSRDRLLDKMSLLKARVPRKSAGASQSVRRSTEIFHALSALGYAAGSVEVLEERGPDPKDAYPSFKVLQQAKNFVHRGQFSEALPLFEEFLEECPRKSRVLEAIGNVFVRASSRPATTPHAQQLQTQSFQLAIRYLSRAIQDTPGLIDANYTLATVFHNSPRHRHNYESQLKKTLELDPYHPEANYHLGQWHFANGSFEGAARYLMSYVEIAMPQSNSQELSNGQRLWAAQHLGDAYLALGRLDEARSAYETARNFDPKAPQPHYGLGRLFERHQQKAKAFAAYSEALNKARLIPSEDLFELPLPEIEAAIERTKDF